MSWLVCLFQFLSFTLQYSTAFSSPISFSTSPSNHLCSPEQSYALLQFKNTFTVEPSVSRLCDDFGPHPYAKTMSWNETTDCCSWDGITCDRLTGHVIELDLSCSQLYGTISPNSSLFSLRNLQLLNLAFNDFTRSQILPSFGQFPSLTHLNLSSSFSGPIPSEISYLSKLVSLDLSSYYQLVSLEPNNFDVMLRNLTQLQQLYFSRVKIFSVVPNSLMNLSSLTYLDLEMTGLFGKLPENIFHLPNLELLYLDTNPQLTGYLPNVNWSSSGSLSDLVLSGTSISGEVPDSIRYLKSLKYLGVGHCNFSGAIPESIGKLVQLISLDLSGNKFQGQIPNAFSNLTQMVALDLSLNNFNGQLVQSTFSNLVQLSYLNISGNHLEGQIPDLFLANLTQITQLSLSGNNFSGQVPSSISSLEQLQYLDISYNNFEGQVPLSFSGLPKLNHLSLQSNHFSGQFPSWVVNMTQLVLLDFAGNALNGPIPSNISGLAKLGFLHLAFNSLNGTLPSWLFSLPSLICLWFQANQFTGNFPPMIYNHKSLEILDLSQNNLSGTIPNSLGNISSVLKVLNLGTNNFHGNIPNSFLEGNKLMIIDLNSNKLEGLVPESLEKCKHLEVLHLGNNKLNDTFPYWLETLLELQVLIMRSNKLHGPISTFRTKLLFPRLRIIDLSHNEFSGLLPTIYFRHFKAMRNVTEKKPTRYIVQILGSHYVDFVKMVLKGRETELQQILTILTTIDLSHNKFTGEIPKVIGKLYSLRSLNLSHNCLIGNIPSSLGNIRMLETLDLSSNQLSGMIPPQLTKLTFLEVLNLSHNHLEGQIPQGNQFNTFENSSYDGNTALCGFPLSRRCGHNETPKLQPPPMSPQEDDLTFASGFTWKVVLLGYGCGMVFGLLMGFLIFYTGKPKWFVRIVEGQLYGKLKRSQKSITRHRGGWQ